MGDTAVRRRRAAGLIAGAVGCTVAIVLTLLAVQSPGYAGSSVNATTRVVWVTNASQFLLGRINRQIDELDSAAALSSADFDVLQDGSDVYAVDNAAHQLRRIDPATVSLSEPLDLPEHAVAGLGGGVVAIADPASGKVWTLPAGDPGDGDVASRTPAATVAPGVVLAVGADGTVAATAPGRSDITVIEPPSGTGNGDRAPAAGLGVAAGHGDTDRPSPPATTPQPATTLPLATVLSTAALSTAAAGNPNGPNGPGGGNPVSITMVGDTPVVLDRPADRLLVRGQSLPLPPGTSGAVLQQPGPAADAVLVATDRALLRISLGGDTPAGTVQIFDPGATGTPAAPVWLNGCAHAAWAGNTPVYLSWCGSVPAIRPIPVDRSSAVTPTGHRLAFRVNRDEIVLNDVTSGDAWLLDPQMTVVNDWSQVAPPREQQSPQNPDRGKENDSDQVSLSRTNCTATVTPPTAKEDSFGVRAGRPAILPVMANDATTDCSAVIIDQVTGRAADEGMVAVVNGGRALQVTAPADATGALPPLSYRVSDSAGHASTATVRISVVPPGEHPAPVRLHGSATLVGVGGMVTDDVLADWVSPAGDPLWLTAVSAQGQDLAVGFEPAGTITVHDTGTGGPGKRTVTFALTDGVNVEHGTLSVDVVATADAAPIVSPVLATAVAGRPVTIHPLASVLVPGIDAARLTAVTAGPSATGLAVARNGDAVTVTAGAPGDYQLTYRVAAGPLAADGVIRLVVTDAAPAPPVAVTDVGYLQVDGQLRLDLTENDIAAGGGVLAIQQLGLEAGSPLVVTLSDMHVAHVSARRPLPPAGAWFSYTESDGTASATGWVHVVPVPAVRGQGPVASPAQLSVRAGDAGTLPLAAFAEDRDGNAMTVQDFTAPPAAGQGLLFAAGDAIRYLAPASPPPSPVHAVYTVTDTAGLSDSATVTVNVIPAGTNHPPGTPPVVQARVFAGGNVNIPLPLDGIDPDGDWVTVAGLDDPGKLGTATVSGPSTIRYAALPNPGADSFSYTATDPSGATTTGVVDVVVVAPPTIAEPPVAPDLKVAVAPGKSLGVDVLDAVSDPAGLAVHFAAPADDAGAAFTVPAGSGLSVRIADGVLAVTAGPEPAVVPVGYTVVNARGLSASGTITVTVTPDAVAVPPTARDIFVDPSMLAPGGGSALVDVTDHVANPGGVPDDVTLGLPPVDGTRAQKTGSRQVTVQLTGSRQVIAYRVTNAEQLTASAFIVVPDRDTLIARAADAAGFHPDTTPLIVNAGSSVDVDVRQYVTGVRPGRTVSMPAGAQVSASTGTLSQLDSHVLRWVVPDPAPPQGLLRIPVTDGVAPPLTVSISATIKPKVVPAPTFQGRQVQVAAGGTTTVDLTPLVTPGGPGQKLTFAGPTGAGQGVTANLAGSRLAVAADVTAAKGIVVDLGVSVSDGVHPPVPATVRVTVVASTAPLAVVSPVSVNGVQGESVTVNVLTAAQNPLRAKGPLMVTDATVASGNGSVSYRADGRVTVTPSDNQLGALVVQVSVADATQDPARVVLGTVTVTVAGKPDRVTGLAAVDAGDGYVDLKWQAPNDNGLPILDYRVTGSGVSQTCPKGQTSCRITGLKNGTTYQFRVTARNRAGSSAVSGPVDATPDVAPNPPGAPILTFGDSQITAAWKAPAKHGSAIVRYQVQISPGPSTGSGKVSVDAGTLTHTFTGLTNGTDYQVTVTAQNSARNGFATSPPANTTPAGKPGKPGRPGLQYNPDAGTVAVTWNPVDGNGDSSITYIVTWTGDDQSHGTLTAAPGKPLSVSIPGAKLGVTYAATVTASNKAGESAAGPSGTVKAFTAVGAPTGVQASATGRDNRVAVSWTAPPYSGWDVTGYQFQIDGQGDWQPMDTAKLPVGVHDSRLTNGVKHTIAIRACTEQSANACGPGAADDVTPYGPPGPVQNVTATAGNGTYEVSWSAAQPNGRDIAGYQYQVNGGVWKDNGGSRSATLSGKNGKSYSVVVLAYYGDDGGHEKSPPSDPATATPYGPVAAPSVRAQGSSQKSVTFAWDPPPDNGLGPYQYRVNGGGSTSATSTSISVACGSTVAISVVAVDSEGHTGPAGSASGTASACPPSYPIGVVGNGGAPTFVSYRDMANGHPGTPRLPSGYHAGIQCRVSAHVIDSDGGMWFQIAPGYTGEGRQTPANNFSNYQSVWNQVPNC